MRNTLLDTHPEYDIEIGIAAAVISVHCTAKDDSVAGDERIKSLCIGDGCAIEWADTAADIQTTQVTEW